MPVQIIHIQSTLILLTVFGTLYGEEPGFWPFVKAAYKANPWPLTGKAEFCAGDAITATLGLTPGFAEYQWRKDGVSHIRTRRQTLSGKSTRNI